MQNMKTSKKFPGDTQSGFSLVGTKQDEEGNSAGDQISPCTLAINLLC